MITKCDECGRFYDDARKFTFCPHDSIMSDKNLAQKDAALNLIGKRICFAHEPRGPVHSVQSIGFHGMVTLSDMEGLFAPHLFVIADF